MTVRPEPSNKYTPMQVGITGGIGSGKTTVCKIFEQINIPVYYADDRAKQIMVENWLVVKKIKNLFGEQAYFPDGSLNRKFIAEIVFNDTSKLTKLNEIVHPAVGEDSAKWHAEHKYVPYTLKEAALLIESGSYKSLDKLIVVTAPKELRISRVMERDNVNRETVLLRMDKQMPEDKKLAFADFVINNDGQNSLIQQVLKIHHLLLESAAKSL